MRWLGPILLAAAAAAFVLWGWTYASPRWTLAQMRRAAAAGDVRRLSAFADYAAMQSAEEAARRAKLRALLASVSPELRARYMAGERERRRDRPEEFTFGPRDLLLHFSPPRYGGEPGREGIEMPSFDRFRVVDRSDPYPDPDGELGFRREGFGWRLVAMQRGYEEFPDGPPRNSWFDRLLRWLRHRN
jgi:hypothetical protein